MNPKRVKSVVIALAMMGVAVLAHVATPSIRLADQSQRLQLEQIFTESFSDWKVDQSLPIILPSPDVQAKLDRIYNQVLNRTYVNRHGERIMLSVAYGGDQSDGTSAHKPEVCYPAQGFEVLSNRRNYLELNDHRIGVRRIVSQLGSRIEPITYWIVIGDRVVTSGTEQKLAQIRFGMRGLIPDGILIRVSSIDKNSEHAFEIQDEFIRSMVAEMKTTDRARLIGTL